MDAKHLREPSNFRPGIADAASSRQWLVLAVAATGFVFDTYELLVQGVVVRPALIDLNFQPGMRDFNAWVGWLLFLPSFAGGIAGLAGGWLTDRFGRRPVLVWSLLIYGAATAGAACATSAAELLAWRCVTLVGVSTEWIAATALVAELFEDRRRRDAALGFTQAMGGLGVLLVGAAYFVCARYGNAWPAIQESHAAWRYALLIGAVPVLPVLIARFFMPESAAWRALKTAGTLCRPGFTELFRPALRRTTIVSVMLVAFIYAAGFGALQHMPRIIPGLAEVHALPANRQEQVIGLVSASQELGSLIGRFAMAALLVAWVGRRRVLRGFQWPALILLPGLFLVAPYLDVGVLALVVLLSGLIYNGQINFIGNYLPQVYPTRLRGVGESFAISVGGRMLGTSAAMLTPWLANFTPGSGPAQKLAIAAAMVAAFACVAGIVISTFLVEPRQNQAGETR